MKDTHRSEKRDENAISEVISLYNRITKADIDVDTYSVG